MLDYLQYPEWLVGEGSNFVDDLFEALWEPYSNDKAAEEARARKQAEFLKIIYGNQTPWWKKLIRSDGKPDVSEEAISGLYTPEHLLKLNLSAWTQENVNDAPCYFIAYNMACALSRMEKGKESLDWLKVAFQMNKELKNIAAKDTDLTYVLGNFKKEYDELVKQW